MKKRLQKKKFKQWVENQGNIYNCVVFHNIGLREMLNMNRYDKCLDRYKRDYWGED